MFYFKVKDDEILKYEIIFDIETFKKVTGRISQRLCIEKSYKYTTYRIPHKNKDMEYKKFDCQKMG